MPSPLNDSNFDSSVGSGVSVVKFSTETCGPCKVYAPIFNSVANSRNDASFYSVDAEQSPSSYAKYGNSGVPFTAIFVNGKMIASRVGGVGADELNGMIDRAVGKLSGPSIIARVESVPSYTTDVQPSPVKNLPLVPSQPSIYSTKTTTSASSGASQSSGSIASEIASIGSAIASVLAPIAASKQAKAAARAQQQQPEHRPPARGPAGSNMKYIVIGGGVLITAVLIYAASRD